MLKKRVIGLIFTLTVALNSYAQLVTGNTRYVDPFIGVVGDGNVFPGVCTPFGMVKLGPDCGNKDWNAGWNPDGNIQGFSHTHVSGTGGGCKYGNVLFLPLTGDINLNDYSSPRANEKTVLGQYEVELSRYHTKARLTAVQHAGFHEYTFPVHNDSKVIIDLGSFLASHERQQFVGSEVRVLSNTTVEGYSRIRGGWNEGGEYTVFFHAEFDTPAKAIGTWKGKTLMPDADEQFDSGEMTGAYFTYATSAEQKIRVRVGISFVSCGKAKENMNQITGWNFDKVHSVNVTKWNDILSKVDIVGNEDDKIKFYTALYHCYLQPVDKTGENQKWKSSEPNYDDFYAIWDTFRATHPLFTLLTPSAQRDMVRSMIDIYRHDGYMPDARSGNDNGRVQGGSNCDILIADAMVKGLQGIDYETALQAMLKNAEVAPGGDERKEGRGGLRDYNSIGYVSTDYERCMTRTFEYANCDFSIATVAKHLGKKDIADKYYAKASNWQNMWNDSISSLGHSGFVWPRNSDGSYWTEDKFNVFAGGTWPHTIYETFPYELSFYVPHDMKKLIRKCGGEDLFVQRLDTFFTHKIWDQRFFLGLFQISNEPGFLIPTLYNYVNRQEKTASIVRYILKNRYKTTPDGIPGNDDSGSMSAWYVFHSLGFYPNAGQDVYLVSSPIFKEATIHLENGKQLIVKTKGNSDKNIYIQSASLNGKPLTNNWFRHKDVSEGGVLEFVMDSKPSKWAQAGEVPPSMSDLFCH